MWVIPGGISSLIIVSILMSGALIFMTDIFRKQHKSLKLAFLNMVIIYLLITFTALSYDYYIDYKLSTFDLDGDGIFSGNENTLEQAKYVGFATNDAGRSFAPITGLAYSFIYSALLYLVLKLISYFGKSNVPNNDDAN
jgi:hypothetical protein